MLTSLLIIYSAIITALFVFVVRLNKSNLNISDMNDTINTTSIKHTFEKLVQLYKNNSKILDMLNQIIQRINYGKTTITDDLATLVYNRKKIDWLTKIRHATNRSTTELELQIIMELIQSNNVLLENVNKVS